MPFPTITGMRRRYLGDDLAAAADGSAVSSWADKSTNNLAMTQATSGFRPILKKTTNGINGHAVVRFDGTDDYLFESTCPNGFNTVFTRFIVAKPAAFSTPQNLLGGSRDYPSGPSLRIGAYGLSQQMIFEITGSGPATNTIDSQPAVSVATTSAAAHVYMYSLASNGNYVIKHDGTTILTGNMDVTGALAKDGLSIGSEAPSDLRDFFNGDVAEVVDYDSILSSGNIALVHSYVQDTYAITVSDYVSGGPLTLTFTDTVGISDTGLQRAVGLLLQDLLGISDSQAKVVGLALTESVGITDSRILSGTGQLNLTLTDVTGISDSIVRTANTFRTYTDVEQITDILILNLVSNGGTIIRGGNQVIFDDLVARGHLTGSILDRERARLLAKTGASPVGNTLYDLYRIANERPRL